jgi:hypothetical protein
MLIGLTSIPSDGANGLDGGELGVPGRIASISKDSRQLQPFPAQTVFEQ